MGRADFAKLGDWDVICDRTGFKCKFSQCVLEEKTNALVLKEVVDPVHPNDFEKSAPENPAVPISRPEAEDVYA